MRNSILLNSDDDADFLAGGTAEVVIPAGQIVFIRVDRGEFGGIILTLVPEIDLRVVSHLVTGVTGQNGSCADPINFHRHQLDHRLDRTGRFLPDSEAACDDRVFDGCCVAGRIAIDVADVGCAAADKTENLFERRAGDGSDLTKTNAQQRAGVARQLVPCGRKDIAADDAPEDLTGGGYQQAGDFLDRCSRGGR